MILNPYELLGVLPTTPIYQVRKNYYALALLAHPDVGGTKEDMITLKACYDWICQQWAVIQSYPEKDFETSKQGFEDFLKDQIREGIPPPQIRDVCAESYGLTRERFLEIIQDLMIHNKRLEPFQTDMAFQYVSHELQLYVWKNEELNDLKAFVLEKTGEVLNKNEIETASIPHGYGEWMDTATQEKAQSFGTTEMILYQEPDSRFPKIEGRDLQLPQQLDDYSKEKLCDYKKAYQLPLPEKEWNDTTSLEERLLAKEMERRI